MKHLIIIGVLLYVIGACCVVFGQPPAAPPSDESLREMEERITARILRELQEPVAADEQQPEFRRYIRMHKPSKRIMQGCTGCDKWDKVVFRGWDDPKGIRMVTGYDVGYVEDDDVRAGPWPNFEIFGPRGEHWDKEAIAAVARTMERRESDVYYLDAPLFFRVVESEPTK